MDPYWETEMSDQELSDLFENDSRCSHCQSDYIAYSNIQLIGIGRRQCVEVLTQKEEVEGKKYDRPRGKWDVLLLNSSLSYGSGYYCAIQISR